MLLADALRVVPLAPERNMNCSNELALFLKGYQLYFALMVLALSYLCGTVAAQTVDIDFRVPSTYTLPFRGKEHLIVTGVSIPDTFQTQDVVYLIVETTHGVFDVAESLSEIVSISSTDNGKRIRFVDTERSGKNIQEVFSHAGVRIRDISKSTPGKLTFTLYSRDIGGRQTQPLVADSSLSFFGIRTQQHNRSPKVVLPTPLALNEDGIVSLDSVYIDDDTEEGLFAVTMSIDDGVFEVTPFPFVTSEVIADRYLFLRARRDDLNAFFQSGNLALGRRAYFTAGKYDNRPIMLDIVVDDNASASSGGRHYSAEQITVAGFNQAPRLEVPSAFVGSRGGDLTLRNIEVEDRDAFFAPLQLTLSATSGSFFANPQVAVDIQGNGTGSLTVSGVVDEINLFLRQNPPRYIPPDAALSQLAITTRVIDHNSIQRGGTKIADHRSVVLISQDGTLAKSYLFWSGLNDVVNIASLYNRSGSSQKVLLQLRDDQGRSLGDLFEIVLAPRAQRDVILNSLDGFAATIGTLEVVTEYDNVIDGHVIQYKSKPQSKDYEFALKNELGLQQFGTAYAIVNTYQPSLHESERDFPIQSWLQLANWGEQPRIFRLEYYGERGEFLSHDMVEVAAQGRRDIDVGYAVFSNSALGIVKIIPLEDEQPYSAQVVRYSSDFTHQRFQFASAASVASGNNGSIISSVSGAAGSSNWIELANVSDTGDVFEVEVMSNSGELVFHQEIAVQPLEQRHIDMASLLGAQSGIVRITPLDKGMAIINNISYFYDGSGHSTDSSSSNNLSLIEEVGFATYNRFIQQSNWMRIFNIAEEQVEVQITILAENGTLPLVRMIELPARSGKDIEVAATLEFIDTYGVVTINSSIPSSIAAQMFRVRQGNDPFSEIDIGMSFTVR